MLRISYAPRATAATAGMKSGFLRRACNCNLVRPLRTEVAFDLTQLFFDIAWNIITYAREYSFHRVSGEAKRIIFNVLGFLIIWPLGEKLNMLLLSREFGHYCKVGPRLGLPTDSI